MTKNSLLLGALLILIGMGLCLGIIAAIGSSKGATITLGGSQGLASTKMETILPVASATPTPVLVQSAQPTATPVALPAEQGGQISGTLGYPSEMIPAMEVVAFKQSDKSIHFSVKTAQNVGTFSIQNVPAGTYVVVAYPTSGTLSGGWTKAVQCGLSVDCKDHTLLPVDVAAGKTTAGVEVKDWYVEAGTFPAKP